MCAPGLRLVFMTAFAVFLLLGQGAALAADPSVEQALKDFTFHLNLIWVLVAAALVFLMQAGFMCVEAGLAQAKHSINVAVKNLADFVLAVILFWAVGFGVMFGQSHHGWFGWSNFFIEVSDPWMIAFFVFQSVFVGTSATIDSGAVAGRTKFRAYLITSACISGLIYPVFGHWAWGGLLNTVSRAGWRRWASSISPARRWSTRSAAGWPWSGSSSSGPGWRSSTGTANLATSPLTT